MYEILYQISLDATNKPALLSLAAVIKARMKHLEKPNLSEDDASQDPEMGLQTSTEEGEEVTSSATNGARMESTDSVEAGSSSEANPNTPGGKGSMCNKFTLENESSSLSNGAGTGKK